MSNDYPNLTKMGVLHPEQIDRYSINSIDYTDTLRIIYRRPKGSLLSESRTYRFPRVQKSVPAKDGGPETTVMEVDPRLNVAVEELKALTEALHAREDTVAEIVEELALLEEDVAMRLDCLRKRVKRLTP